MAAAAGSKLPSLLSAFQAASYSMFFMFVSLMHISVILIWLSWKRLMGFPKAMRLFACAIASSKAQMAVP